MTLQDQKGVITGLTLDHADAPLIISIQHLLPIGLDAGHTKGWGGRRVRERQRFLPVLAPCLRCPKKRIHRLMP